MPEFSVDRRGAVKAEIGKDGASVVVKFDYHPERVLKIKGDAQNGRHKGVPSRRFIPADHKSGEGPGWRINLDLDTMRRLREVFGEELALGPKLREWGHREVGEVRNLAALSDQNDAELSLISKPLQKWLRPYQRADTRFMAETSVLCANMPRTGKTPTYIASVIEADLMWGQHLVFAPLQALRDVWELGILNIYLRQQIKTKPRGWNKNWVQEDYYKAYESYGADLPTILTGDTPDERRAAIDEAVELAEGGYSFWLVLNPYMGRAKEVWYIGKKRYEDFKRMPKDKGKPESKYELLNPGLLEVEWDTIGVDEFHLCGLSNPNTVTAQGMNLIRQETEPERAHTLSGTPMGGKPIKLWGALHFSEPDKFPSRWNWARMWLTIQENDYGASIEGLAPGVELDFYNHLAPHFVRRTQRDALPGFPDTNRIPVWCEMTPKQRAQYDQMATEAEWALESAEEEGQRLSATNILALYTRLSQFADAYCDVEKTGKETELGLPELKVRHTAESGKLDMLIEKLQEVNVIGTSKDMDENLKCALVASQFVPMVAMLETELKKKGVPVARLVAGKKKINEEIVRSFQTQADGAPRVLVMNTLMGTALTLDRAETVHIMDETWNPDDQEQMENRAMPTTEELMKARPDLGVYYYRSRRSIDEYRQKVNIDKSRNNKTILDLRRLMAEAEADRKAGDAG